jgi:2-methylcitrate dehydratase PrpD
MLQTAEQTEGESLSLALADEILAITVDSLSDADVEQLKRLILDHLGICIRGASLPWGLALREWAARYDGAGPCVAFGSPLRVTAPVAALVNGTAAHGMELDDTHDESLSHPGAVVIAAALAVATADDQSGGEMLAAIAAGYQVMGRAGIATHAGTMIERGFHPTSLYGTFGATTAAGKLLGLDGDRLCSAWGLALSLAGGSTQFSQEAKGSTVKRLHGGYGAHNGVLAAELAQLGIEGPAQAFDGLYGLCNMFGSDPEPERMLRASDEPLEIHRISMKPYPCCRLFHSTIDALGETTDGFTLELDEIESIRVGAPAVMLSQHMMRRPASMMAAQYSLPFALAATLVEGPRVYEAYAAERLGNEQVLALADRVEAVVDDEMERAFPSHLGSWVEVRTKEGQVRRSSVLDSLGTPARPMPSDAIHEKFEMLVSGLPGIDGARIAAAVEDLPDVPSVTDLAALFRTA